METHLLRLQSDLQKCVSLIQDPRKLKSSLQSIYARYVCQAEQVSASFSSLFRELFPNSTKCEICKPMRLMWKVEEASSEVEVKRMLCRQRDHMDKTVGELRAKLAKAAEDHEKVYVRIMKVKIGNVWKSPPPDTL